jgi:reverse gyrase
MEPIYKFNNGRGATLCHLCRTIITTGKMTNDLYCDRCLNERVKTEEEFAALKKFHKQMDKEVHNNPSNLNI